MVVGREKTNKESVSGTAGFEPQAQSVKAHGQCLGLISGSTCDPALHLLGGSNLTVPSQFHHCQLLDLLHSRIVGDHGCKVLMVHNTCDWDERK